MKNYMMMRVYIIAVVFYGQMIIGSNCANLAKEPANVSLLKNDVKKYRASGTWEQSIECSVEKAKAALQEYLPMTFEKPAVVFDIDETVLSNWKIIEASDFGYNRRRYKHWESLAKDKPIVPVRHLYKFAQSKGFAVFLITGRRENQRAATERNLKKAGFTHWNGVFFKPMDFIGTKAMEFKSKWRAHIKEMGYTIVLNIGDQQSDLDGEPHAIYDFKIANPAYFIP